MDCVVTLCCIYLVLLWTPVDAQYIKFLCLKEENSEQWLLPADEATSHLTMTKTTSETFLTIMDSIFWQCFTISKRKFWVIYLYVSVFIGELVHAL